MTTETQTQTGTGPAALNKRLTEKNSHNVTLPNKINYLYDILRKAILGIHHGTMESKINNLWCEIRDSLDCNFFYDLDYLYDVFMLYEEYLKITLAEPAGPIILAFLLSRIAGRGKSFDESARLARTKLLNDFKLPECFCNHVQELILTQTSPDFSLSNKTSTLILHLNLARLALPWHEFIENQYKIRRDGIFYADNEFFQIQKEIYSKLLLGHWIFDYVWFRKNFEITARDNLKRFIPVLQERINALNFMAESKNQEKEKVEKIIMKIPATRSEIHETPQEWYAKIKEFGENRKKPFEIQNDPVTIGAPKSLREQLSEENERYSA